MSPESSQPHPRSRCSHPLPVLPKAQSACRPWPLSNHTLPAGCAHAPTQPARCRAQSWDPHQLGPLAAGRNLTPSVCHVLKLLVPLRPLCAPAHAKSVRNALPQLASLGPTPSLWVTEQAAAYLAPGAGAACVLGSARALRAQGSCDCDSVLHVLCSHSGGN